MRGASKAHSSVVSDDRRGSYRRWLERSSTTTIFVYSALIIAFFPAFHFVLGATPGVPPDSLALRVAAAAIAAAVSLALLLAPSLRRYSPNLQLLNVLPTVIASPILVVNSGNDPAYIAGSLILAIGVQQAFYRTRDFVIVLATTLGVEVLYSAMRGVFFTPANLNALALTGSGFFVAMSAGILRLRVQRNERELRSIVRDRTRELSEANAKLEEMSVTDPLTGLRNRRFLAQHLEFEVAAALRRTGDVPDADLLFFLIDLDHFKAVNDTFGHNAGDLVLMQMRDRLREVFRESDFLVRWGGEEFLVVTRSSRRHDACDIAERARAAVAQRPFALERGQRVNASCSIGFAPFPFVPYSPLSLSWMQVVALADRALYLAKERGRNTWVGATAGRVEPDALAERLAILGIDAFHDGTLDVLLPK